MSHITAHHADNFCKVFIKLEKKKQQQKTSNLCHKFRQIDLSAKADNLAIKEFDKQT